MGVAHSWRMNKHVASRNLHVVGFNCWHGKLVFERRGVVWLAILLGNYFNFKFETRFWEAGQQEGQSFHKLHLWRHQQNHLVTSLEDSRTKHGKTKVSLVSLLLQSFQLSKQEKNTFKITIKNTRSETMEEGSKITPTGFVSTPCPPKFAWMSHHLHAKSTWEAMGIMVGSWWMRQKNHEFLYIVYTD